MKKILRTFALVAAAAAALTACQKESGKAVENGIKIKVVADESALKTAIVDGETSAPSVKWLASDAIGLFETIEASRRYSSSTNTTLSDNDKKATFDITLIGDDPGASTYIYTAAYPAGSISQGSSFYRFMMPAEQNVGIDGGFDPAADILLGKPITRTSRATEGETIAFQFARPGSMARFTVKGIEAGEVINSVTITAPENVAGYCKFDINTGEVTDKAYSNASKTITLTTPVSASYVATGTDIFFFRLLDGIWLEGSELSVTVDTDKAVYTKKVNLPKNYVFADGGLTLFSMANLTRTEKGSGDKYFIVTSAADLSAGDQIIIVSAASDYALGTTQNNNNRVAVSISKYGEGSEAYVEDPSEDVQIITVAEGSVAGSIALQVGEAAYLNAPGGGNYLRTVNSVSASSSWTVAISDTYVATITSQGTATQKYIRKNASSALFSCYGSGQQDVNIYKLDDGKEPQTLSFPESSYEASIETGFSAPAVSGAETSPLSWASSNEDVATVDENGSVSLIATGTTVITVTAPASTEYRAGSASYTLTVTGPVIDPVANPQAVAAAGGTAEVEYNVTNPIGGGSLSADWDADWITDIQVDSPSEGKITITVAANSDAARSATVTLSYPLAQDVTFTVSQLGGSGSNDYSTTFTSKSWANTAGDAVAWTSGADGSQFQSGRGVQVTAGYSGANATTTGSFTGATKAVVTYSTNASKGVGSIALTVGSEAAVSQAVTKTGGTTDRTLEFTLSGDGAVNLTVTCTENSIYVKSIVITASGYAVN